MSKNLTSIFILTGIFIGAFGIGFGLSSLIKNIEPVRYGQLDNNDGPDDVIFPIDTIKHENPDELDTSSVPLNIQGLIKKTTVQRPEIENVKVYFVQEKRKYTLTPKLKEENINVVYEVYIDTTKGCNYSSKSTSVTDVKQYDKPYFIVARDTLNNVSSWAYPVTKDKCKPKKLPVSKVEEAINNTPWDDIPKKEKELYFAIDSKCKFIESGGQSLPAEGQKGLISLITQLQYDWAGKHIKIESIDHGTDGNDYKITKIIFTVN